MKTFQIVAMFLVTMLLIHPISQYIAYQRGQHLNGQVVLPDLFHQILPDNQHRKYMGNYLGCGLTVVFLILTYQRGNSTDFFDWIKVLAMIFILKSLTMIVTTVPDSQGTCQYKGFLNLGGCNDSMFSCHTAYIASTLLFLSLLVPSWTYPLLAGYMAVAAYFIVSTRNHYSVDILMGLYVAVTLFLLRNKF